MMRVLLHLAGRANATQRRLERHKRMLDTADAERAELLARVERAEVRAGQMLQTPPSFQTLCSCPISGFGAQLRLCDAAAASADHIGRGAPNSPRRRPQLAFEWRCSFCAACAGGGGGGPRAAGACGTNAADNTPRMLVRFQARCGAPFVLCQTAALCFANLNQLSPLPGMRRRAATSSLCDHRARRRLNAHQRHSPLGPLAVAFVLSRRRR